MQLPERLQHPLYSGTKGEDWSMAEDGAVSVTSDSYHSGTVGLENRTTNSVKTTDSFRSYSHKFKLPWTGGRRLLLRLKIMPCGYNLTCLLVPFPEGNRSGCEGLVGKD